MKRDKGNGNWDMGNGNRDKGNGLCVIYLFFDLFAIREY